MGISNLFSGPAVATLLDLIQFSGYFFRSFKCNFLVRRPQEVTGISSETEGRELEVVKENLHVVLEPKQKIFETSTMRVHTSFRLVKEFTPQQHAGNRRYLTCLTQWDSGQELRRVLTVVERNKVRWDVFPPTANRTVDTAYVQDVRIALRLMIVRRLRFLRLRLGRLATMFCIDVQNEAVVHCASGLTLYSLASPPAFLLAGPESGPDVRCVRSCFAVDCKLRLIAHTPCLACVHSHVTKVSPTVLPAGSSGLREVRLLDNVTVAMKNPDDRPFEITRDVYWKLARLRDAVAAVTRCDASPPNPQPLLDATQALATLLMPRAWDDSYENDPDPVKQAVLNSLSGVDDVIAAGRQVTALAFEGYLDCLANCDGILYFAVKVSARVDFTGTVSNHCRGQFGVMANASNAGQRSLDACRRCQGTTSWLHLRVDRREGAVGAQAECCSSPRRTLAQWLHCAETVVGPAVHVLHTRTGPTETRVGRPAGCHGSAKAVDGGHAKEVPRYATVSPSRLYRPWHSGSACARWRRRAVVSCDGIPATARWL